MGTSGIGRAGRMGLGIALVGALAGCASAGGGGGAGGGWEAGRQWGCDPAQLRRDYEDSHPAGTSLDITPRTGWGACQLLALVGAPQEVRTSESAAGETFLLYYPGAPHPRVVTLRRDVTRSWRVSAVVW